MPVDYSKYPSNWKSEIRPAILERDGHCCKFCGVPNYSIGFRNSAGHWEEIEKSFAGDMYAEDMKEIGFKIIKIVLTVMHIDHDTENNDYSNLAAACQKCHLNHDKELHQKNSRATREKKKGLTNKLF